MNCVTCDRGPAIGETGHCAWCWEEIEAMGWNNEPEERSLLTQIILVAIVIVIIALVVTTPIWIWS
jgi:hypothetical protein